MDAIPDAVTRGSEWDRDAAMVYMPYLTQIIGSHASLEGPRSRGTDS